MPQGEPVHVGTAAAATLKASSEASAQKLHSSVLHLGALGVLPGLRVCIFQLTTPTRF